MSSTPSNSGFSVPVVTQEHWSVAKQIATPLTYVPASFSTAIRSLLADHAQNGKKLRPVTKYQIGRLMQGQSFKALIYYASKSIQDDRLPKGNAWNVGQLIDLFEPFDVAAMIGAFLMTRKCRKLLSIPGWAKLEAEMNDDSQIAAHLGRAVPAIGVGLALIINTFRWFGYAALVKKNEKNVVPYKIHLKQAGVRWDFVEERKLWGCSSKEIGVFLLSSLGFGVEVGDAFSTALEPSCPVERMQNMAQMRARLALLWIETLKKGESQPTANVPGEFYPLVEARSRLANKVDEVLGSSKHWLVRTKDEVSATLTPELFAKPGGASDIPPELAAIFSVDEISKMDENDFDKLIDQIDDEAAGKVIPGTVSSKDIKELEEMVAE